MFHSIQLLLLRLYVCVGISTVAFFSAAFLLLIYTNSNTVFNKKRRVFRDANLNLPHVSLCVARFNLIAVSKNIRPR